MEPAAALLLSDVAGDVRLVFASDINPGRINLVFYHAAEEVGQAMSLNIKNPAVERLADEVARLTGESKTEAIRKALEERRARLNFRVAGDNHEARLRRFLAQELWPIVPPDQLGKKVGRDEEEAILGYGPEGV